MLSVPHMIVLFLVVLVVFGPQKLPELARGLGKLMAEFRKASTDFKSAFEEEMREMERAAMQAERKKAAEAAAASAAVVETSPPALTEGSAVTVAPASEAQPEQGATQDPVILPVAESVPRSPEAWTETKTETATVTDSQDALHDHQHPA
ncbi:MAG TPA: twin-arginine translocase TatA/TatE family subunit [Candidatus Acidoferrum sp.]